MDKNGTARPAAPAARPEPAGGFSVGLIAGSALLIAVLFAVAALTGRSLSPLTWYIARASGLSLYISLWVATVGGLALTTSLLDRWVSRGGVLSVHAFATQLAYGFLALHMLSIAADPTVNYGFRELLVPFEAGWREPWTGLGVLAGQLTVIIGVSFSLRSRIGTKTWRALHWLTFPLFGMALLHGVGAGTDTSQAWVRALYLATGAVVVTFTLYRVLRGARGSQRGGTQAPARRMANAYSGD